MATMTIILAFITAHLGAILGAALGAGGFIFGAFRHQQAKAATSNAQAVIAQSKASDAQANADAQAHADQAVVNKQQATEEAAQVPVSDLDAELDKEGGLRK
jgi:membrane protein involved in colicin uptake